MEREIDYKQPLMEKTEREESREEYNYTRIIYR